MSGPEAKLTDYASVKDYLYALKAGGVKFGIDRMRRLSAALGHPERSYPVIHVAGTNGKGSVSAMIEAILHTAGWRTGLYTSPHLVKLGERVQVDRQLLTEAEIVAYAGELMPIAAKIASEGNDEHPTFFEFMTAMAFLQFQRKRVDIAIVEVGMGGRLDATNVVQPDITVITSIGLDHVAELGNSFAQIAREKAGIIKPNCPVVIGRLPAEAEKVIREVAAEKNAPVHSVREAFGDTIENFPQTNLAGDYQRWNAATTTLAAKLLPAKWELSDTVIARGLQAVDWPGRWQRVTLGGRSLVLDASHNPEGVEVLEQNLRNLIAETGRKPIIVAGALGEFRARALLDVVLRYGEQVYLITPKQARASTFEEMINWVPIAERSRVHRAEVETVFPDANTCTLGATDQTVVVTGSIYLLGEVLERIEPRRGAGEGKLQDF
ncbi:bifunctional folylpolyglutamate synthase/dihydrofolate synthase [Oleiharenicola lentus]|uniref:bifunctional folylpolyglutamate synthase/dihydrofolate synthase n=1 Tax=Oleiharenicola lentus TaxID=2508720 RepID=UPI003F680100